MIEKYFICYLKTGGGHFAPSKSLFEYFNKNYENKVEPILIDGLENSSKAARFIIEDGYRLMQNHAKWYYELIYAANKIFIFKELNIFLCKVLLKKYFKNRIKNDNPSKIIIVHFLLIEPIVEAIKDLKLNIPVYVLITDPFSIHSIWLKHKKLNYIVFSEVAKQICIKNKIKENSVLVFPFILNSKFNEQLNSKEIRNIKLSYNIEPSKKIILIIGGGDGIPRGNQIIKSLIKNKNYHFIMVCGRNKKLFNDVVKLKDEHDNLTVFTFSNKIYEFINISHLVITKAGASIIFEILSQNKIPIITDYIWEQELGNKDFVVNNSLGFYENKIKNLNPLIRDLVENENHFLQIQKKIYSLKIKNGTKEICEYLVKSKTL